MSRLKTSFVLACTIILTMACMACHNQSPIIADKGQLQAAIASAESVMQGADYASFTEQSREEFEDALSTAKTVNNTLYASQTQVDTAISRLVTAQNNLALPPIGQLDSFAGSVMIWQVGAAPPTETGAIHQSFIELYNNSDTDLDLQGYSLQYSSGGADWNVIALIGTIKARSSYLVLGSIGESNSSNRLLFASYDADLSTSFAPSGDQYKILLIHSLTPSTVVNPFNVDGNSNVLDGYVDMLGAVNSSTIDAFEGSAPASKMSKQHSLRRTSLTDTNDNSQDFALVDYSATGISDQDLLHYRPKNQSYGSWNPLTS